MGNLLFCEGILTGYIDFDLSQVNARCFDLAYFTLGWLINHFNTQEEGAQWLKLLAAAVSGYHGKLPLTEAEKQAMIWMMLNIELLFVSYFTQKEMTEAAENAAAMVIWLWNHQKEINAVVFASV